MTSMARRRDHEDSEEYSDASQDIEHNNSGHVSTVTSHNSVNFRFGAKSITAYFLSDVRVTECPFLLVILRSRIGHHSLKRCRCV